MSRRSQWFKDGKNWVISNMNEVIGYKSELKTLSNNFLDEFS